MASKAFSYLSSAELTDVGHRRKNNEDAVLRLPDNGVFCVADGMGGVQGGEVASKATVDALQKEFTESPDAPFAVTANSSARLIERAINGASRWIKERADGLGLTGTGSTAVVLAFDQAMPSKAIVLHAGDSRAYRYRGDRLVQLTTDHSVAAAAGLRDDKTLPAMFRGVITRAVGLERCVRMESTAVEVLPGDIFLLCSDGLDKMLSDRQIHKLLRRHQDDDVQEVAKALIAAALEEGGEDNVSVVLVRVAKDLPPEPALEISPQTLALEQLVTGESSPESRKEDDFDETGETANSVPQTSATVAEKMTPSEGGNLVGSTPVTPVSGSDGTPVTLVAPVPPASVPVGANRAEPAPSARPAVARRRGTEWTAWLLLALALGAGIWALVRWREAKDAAELQSVLPLPPVAREARPPVPPQPEPSAVPRAAETTGERQGTGE